MMGVLSSEGAESTGKIASTELERRIAEVDFLAVVERHTTLKWQARTNGGEYAGPCPLCGGKDRFRVWPHHPSGRGRFWCRNASCPAHEGGDAVDFVRLVEGLDFRGALEFLGISHPAGGLPRGRTRVLRRMMSAPATPRRPVTDTKREGNALLSPVDLGTLADRAQHHLWRPEGRQAMVWLRGRGLSEETIRTWRLGYNPTPRRQEGVWLPRGVFIPYLNGSTVVAIKVRSLPHKPGKPKYVWIRGSKAGFFGLHRLEGRKVLVVVESELDAILVWQEAGDLVDAVATSSASYRPTPEALALLTRCPHWLLIRDVDRAGEQQATWWSAFSARVEVVSPPRGKDPTEYLQQGGDLREWLIQEGVSRGWFRRDSRVTYPVTIVWPENTHPATISGQWRRRANGEIVATYRTPKELATALLCMRSLNEGNDHEGERDVP